VKRAGIKNNSQSRKVLAITGPTASGKTKFSILVSELLKQHGIVSEIISADSRQVYKHIPIATCQPIHSELKKVKHHFISFLEPDENFNAGEFGELGRKKINLLFSENKLPVIVGGSGLYVNSLIYGFFEFDIDDAKNIERKSIRKNLEDKLTKEGKEKLLEELNRVDFESAEKMRNVNPRRIIRALEVFKVTGIPLSQFQKQKIEINFQPVIYALSWDRKKLYERINKRVDEMLEEGLIKEVKTLQQEGFHFTKQNSLNTVGIKEAFDCLEGKTSEQRMVELIKQNSRRYAKRQLTWFRKNKDIKWLEINDENEIEKLAEEVVEDFFTT